MLNIKYGDEDRGRVKEESGKKREEGRCGRREERV